MWMQENELTTRIRSIHRPESRTETDASHWSWFNLVGSTAALSVGIMLLAAVPSFVLAGLQPLHGPAWLSPIQDNWLMIIFKLQAGLLSKPPDPLYGWNPLDFTILALAGATYLGLYASLKRTGKFLALIALVQPFFGMALFLLTKTAGRSAFMGAEIVISLLMLRSQRVKKFIAYLGIVAGVLLLAGDLGVAMAPSVVLATLTGMGYILGITWFFLIAHWLIQLKGVRHV
jgi:hypothetical protein